MEFSEVEALSVTAFCIVSAAGYQGEGKTFTVFEFMKVKNYLGLFIAQFCCVQYCFLSLTFHFKGSKVLNGGCETQDTNQSQQNGENTEEKKDKHEAVSKKK